MEPRVEVDGVASHIAPLEGGTATAWIFLAMVLAGSHQVVVTVGNVVASQQVEIETGAVTHVDFIFVKGNPR